MQSEGWMKSEGLRRLTTHNTVQTRWERETGSRRGYPWPCLCCPLRRGRPGPPAASPPSQGQGEAALCLGEVRRAPEGMMPMRELLSISGFPPVSETSFYVDREEPVLDGLWPAHFLS